MRLHPDSSDRRTFGPVGLTLVLLMAAGAACPVAVGQPQELASSPYAPMARSAAELDAFRAIELETLPRLRLPLITMFLESFPRSELRYLVVRNRWRAFVDSRRNPEDVILAAEEALDSANEFLGGRLASRTPGADRRYQVADLELRDLRTAYYRSMVSAARRLDDLPLVAEYTRHAVQAGNEAWNSYQAVVVAGSAEYENRRTTERAVQLGLLRDAMVAFRRAGDLDMVVEFGSQALEVDPDDFVTLMVLSAAMSETSPGGSPPSADNVSKASEHALHAIEVLDGVLPGPIGPLLSASNRTVFEAYLRSTIGWIHYHQRDYVSAAEELSAAAVILPRDATLYYRLGLVYSAAARSADSLSALARAAYLFGEVGDTVEKSDVLMRLERVYTRQYGSTEGLDSLIAREGAALELEGGAGD